MELTDIDFTVNEERCFWSLVDVVPENGPGSDLLFESCLPDGTCNPVIGAPLEIPAESQFTVTVLGYKPPDPKGFGPCVDIEDGGLYVVSVDITYAVDIGGATATKHSIGEVRLAGTPGPP